MTGASTNPKKMTLKYTYIIWLIVWKYSPIFLFLNLAFVVFYWGWGQVQNLLRPTYANSQLSFCKYSPICWKVIFFSYNST